MDVELFLTHPAPAPGEALSVRALLRIRGSAPEGSDRTPLNLGLVLDHSGSMHGSSLDEAKKATELLLRRIWPEDTVSVVAYHTQVTTLAEGVSGEEREGALRAVGALEAQASTNLSGGWLRGCELVEKFRKEGRVDRVILLTDGLANVGIRDPGMLADLCRAAAARGVSTTTIGFGAGFNEDLLVAMADAGQGSSYYVEEPDQASGIFEEELAGLLSLAAQNVRVEVGSGDGVELTAVRHSYPGRRDVRSASLELGDLYSREPRDLLLEFLLPPADATQDVAVAEVLIHGAVLTAEGGIERRSVRLPIRLRVGDAPRVSPEVERLDLLLGAADAREEALELQRQGDWEGAAMLLERAADGLEPAAPQDPEAAREARDLRAMANRLRQRAFTVLDLKYMKQHAYDGKRSQLSRKERYLRDLHGQDLE